jgi:hypothetical protein
MKSDGSFFSKDYFVWEQVAGIQVKNAKPLGKNALEKPMI